MKQLITVTLSPAFDLHCYTDTFLAEAENLMRTVTSHVGGKGINISRALTANGVANLAYVVLGDENGKSFEDALIAEQIPYVPFYTKGRIRENVTVHPKVGKETRISLCGFPVDEELLSRLEADLLGRVTRDTDLALAGRLPDGISKERAILFLERLQRAGARLILDSNAFSKEDLQRIHPFFIKPNEQEAEKILGVTVREIEQAAAAARRAVQDGVAEEVMITLGDRGAVWSDGQKTLAMQPPRLEVPVSTIGAGDSTVAGFLAARAADESVENAMREALAYGTAACLREGTQPPLPQDVDTIRKQIRIIS